jgi:hypothetical protein
LFSSLNDRVRPVARRDLAALASGRLAGIGGPASIAGIGGLASIAGIGGPAGIAGPFPGVIPSTGRQLSAFTSQNARSSTPGTRSDARKAGVDGK